MQTLSHSQPKLAERHQRRKSIISLTPLIDVVFILLVFFMLASSFLDWRSITLQTVTPAATATTEPPSQPLLVSVSESEVQLHGEPMPVEQLITQLKQALQADNKAIVHIKPVGDTALQPVIQLLDQLKGADIERIKLVPDPVWQAANSQQP